MSCQHVSNFIFLKVIYSVKVMYTIISILIIIKTKIMEGIKYNPNPTPEDWKKAQESMSNEQKLSSDLRQMEIRPSQEQLKQIIFEDVVNGREIGGNNKSNTKTEKQRTLSEEELNGVKKTLREFREILNSDYLNSLKEDDFICTYLGTYEFEGREHANLFVNFKYKGGDFEFTFGIGSNVSRVASKLLPENFDERFEEETRNDLLIALREGIKEDIHSYIKHVEDFISKQEY